MKNIRKSLVFSMASLILCVLMLIGTTFAWFTDTASSGVNKIQAGTLDVGLEYKVGENWDNAEGKMLSWVKAPGHEGEGVLWEPGCTYTLPELRVVNKGTLALKYKVVITGIQGSAKLNEAIEWTITMGGTETSANSGEYFLLPANQTGDALTISGHMKETAGNEYQGLSIEGIEITVYAAQYSYEADSFDNIYDTTTSLPATASVSMNKEATEDVVVTTDGRVKSAKIPFEAANDVFSDTDLNNGIDPSADKVLTITTTVVPTSESVEGTKDVINLEINMNAVMISGSTTNTKEIKSLSDYSTIVYMIPAGKNNVVVTHKGNAMEAMAEATSTVTDPNGGYYYEKSTGKLTIKTKSFSPFEVKFDLES